MKSMAVLALMLFAGEREEVAKVAPRLFGPSVKIEQRLYDGTRVDILTETYAIEADFADNWYQAIGQSLYYSELTDRLPGILLLKKKSADNQWRHLVRAAMICGKHDIKFWVVEYDDR
jgi:hypothetical protein